MGERALDGRSLRASAKRAARRKEILDGALRVFAEKGYHGAHVRDIIDEVGIARGTFYLYFESKNAIFLELLDGLLKELRSHIIGVETGEGAPGLHTQLVTTMREILGTVLQNRSLSTVIVREAVGLDDDVDQRLASFYQELHAYLRDSVAEGQRLGLLRPVDPDIAAMSILGTIKQLIEQVVRGQMSFPDPTDTSEIDSVAMAILDVTLFGLLPR